METEGLAPYKITRVEVTEDTVGCGSYATVLKLKYMGLICAGKKIHNLPLEQQGSATHTLHRFEKECQVLSQICHPNIVQFLGVYIKEGAKLPVIVMELLPMNLTSCIELYGILPKEISYSILHDVALALHYLHSQSPPIMHQHFSSNNVLLTPNMTAKVSDHGVAKLLDLSPQEVIHTIQPPGIRTYIPQELMTANPRYDIGVDEFSYGILMIHIFCGDWPEPKIHVAQLQEASNGNVMPLTKPERNLKVIDSNHPFSDLILRCIDNEPTRRANMSEIIERTAIMTSQFPASFTDRLEMLRQIEADREEKESLKEKLEKKQTLLEEKEKIILAQTSELSQLNRAYANDLAEHRRQIQALKDEKHTLLDETEVYSRKTEALSAKEIATTRKQMKEQEDMISNAFQVIQQSLSHHRQIFEAAIIKTNGERHNQDHKHDDSKGHKSKHLPLSKKPSIKSPINESDGTSVGTWLSKKFSKGKGQQKPKQSRQATEGNNNYPVYVGTHDYEPQQREDLGFKKDEQMFIIESDGDWWLARSKETGKEGYVPRNFVKEYRISEEKELYTDINEFTSQCDSGLDREAQATDYVVPSPSLHHNRTTPSQDSVYDDTAKRANSSTQPRVTPTFSNQQQKDGNLVSDYANCYLMAHNLPEISRSQLNIIRKLSLLDDFKEMWEGVLNDQTPVLIQMPKCGCMSYADIINEAETLNELSHPNILKLHGVCTTDGPAYMVTEFLQNGSLNSYLKDEAQSLTDHALSHMAYQIVCAMAYLEANNYVHRDLSTFRIQVGENQICKLADFRLAQANQEDINLQMSVKFAVRWSAPEVFIKRQHSIKSDVWSFGIVFYAIITYGKKPYEDIDTKEELLMLLEQGYRMPQPEWCQDELYAIMLSCWEMEPENRPSFAKLQSQLRANFQGYTLY